MPKRRSVTLTDEQKEAIRLLPDKKKIQLLHRLVRKEPKLVDQIQYQYVEMQETQELRREDVQEQLEEVMQEIYVDDSKPLSWWLGYLRGMSGKISWHSQVTKDVYGEVYLNLLMITRCLAQLDGIKSQTVKVPAYGRGGIDHFSMRKVSEYCYARSRKLCKLMTRVHEDLWLELRPMWEQIAEHLRGLDLDEMYADEQSEVEQLLADVEELL